MQFVRRLEPCKHCGEKGMVVTDQSKGATTMTKCQSCLGTGKVVVPHEHRPFGVRVQGPTCPKHRAIQSYCIGMWCDCEKHEDFNYSPRNDGFTFYFPCCQMETQVTVKEQVRFEQDGDA